MSYRILLVDDDDAARTSLHSLVLASLPGTEREPVNVSSNTVRPTRTAPGCQVTEARPSSVWTLPAIPRRTVCLSIDAGGSGAATTTPVTAAVADVEPPAPVAVTMSESVQPMSSGVSV